MVDFKRLAIVAVVILLVQQFLGTIISGSFPAVTQWGLIGLTVGGVVTVGSGLYLGNWVADALKVK